MRAESIARAGLCALIIGGTSILAAPDQTTRTPGQMTEAHVWVQNRGKNEAVPVELREVNLDAPLKVQVINGDPAFSRVGPILVTATRKTWEYQKLIVRPTEDMASSLVGPGMNGWETTAIWSASADGTTTVILKRQR